LVIGIWIDANIPNRFSWTLMGLMIGLFVGCLNAWYWLNSEGRPDMTRRKTKNVEMTDVFENHALALAWRGSCLGLFYFGGLWLTVQQPFHYKPSSLC
jgi:hypothetical protein